MESRHILLTLAIAQILVAMSPGPNTVLVLQNATRGRKLGFATSAGIFPAGLFWAIIGAVGSGSLLLAHPQLLMGMYLACGSYLCWLGFKSIRGSFQHKKITKQKASKDITVAAAFRSGILTNITNPKTIAYYASIFTATGMFAMSRPYQVLAVGMMPAISFMWFAVLIMLITHKPVQRFMENAQHWLDRVSGLVMMGFGLRLLMMLIAP